MLSRLAEEILLSGRCAAGMEHGFASPLLAPEHRGQTLDEIDTALSELAANGLLESDPRPVEGRTRYSPTRLAWRTREELLRRRGARHVLFGRLANYELRDVVLAIAVAAYDRARRVPPGYFTDRGKIAVDVVCTYLYDIPETDVRSAVEALLGEKLIEAAHVPERSDEPAGVLVTFTGIHFFRETARQRLALGENENVLDEVRIDKILIFYSWQSDVSSRSEIEEALHEAISRIDAGSDPIRPITVTEATRPGDGAGSIDQLILQRIREAHIVVADLTTIGACAGRRTPNPNVLFEVGYALGVKESEDVILLASRPIGDARAGKARKLPFDVDHLRRHDYSDTASLASWLYTELHARLAGRNWLRAL